PRVPWAWAPLRRGGAAGTLHGQAPALLPGLQAESQRAAGAGAGARAGGPAWRSAACLRGRPGGRRAAPLRAPAPARVQPGGIAGTAHRGGVASAASFPYFETHAHHVASERAEA